MRHTFAWFALVALLIAATIGIAAAQTATMDAAAAQPAPLPGSTPIAITINGEAQQFLTPPIMMNGQVMVPMRDVFQALNTPVVWDASTKAVTAHNSQSQLVSLQIGSPEAMVGSRQVTLARAPVLYENRTYVPLQFVQDALGAQVAFDATGQTITIASAAPAVASAEVTAPQQFAEAPPVTVAPAQPMVPPAPQYPPCPPGYVRVYPNGQVVPQGQVMSQGQILPQGQVTTQGQIVAQGQVLPQGQMMSQGQMMPQSQMQQPVASQSYAQPYGNDPPAQVQPQVVTVIEREYKITVNPTSVAAGPVTLQIRNEGDKTHALAIESTNLRTPDIKPGQAAVLTFTAQAGQTYTLYCPVDAHKELGMKVRLPVR